MIPQNCNSEKGAWPISVVGVERSFNQHRESKVGRENDTPAVAANLRAATIWNLPSKRHEKVAGERSKVYALALILFSTTLLLVFLRCMQQFNANFFYIATFRFRDNGSWTEPALETSKPASPTFDSLFPEQWLPTSMQKLARPRC